MASSATLELRAKDVNTERELSRTLGLIQKFGTAAIGAFAAVGAAVAAAFAVDAIIDWGSYFVDAASGAEQASVRLGAVLKNNAGVVGLTQEQLSALATELQNVSGVSDEVVQKAEAMALKFKNIRGDVFVDLIKVANDYAEATETDLVGATERLGRALEDPIRAITRLRREGISFSEAQKEQIETLTRSGKVMEAQKIVLDAIRERYGGVAEAMGNTFSGRLKIINERFGDMAEVVGAAIIPLFDLIEPMIMNAATALENMLPAITAFGEGFKTAAEAGLAALKPFFEWMVDQTIFTISAAQVLWENWGLALEVQFKTAKLGVISFYEDVKHIFTVNIPEALSWFMNNWREVFDYARKYAETQFEIMITTLINAVKEFGKDFYDAHVAALKYAYDAVVSWYERVKDLLLGKGGPLKFKALEDGIKSTIASLPGLPSQPTGTNRPILTARKSTEEEDRLRSDIVKGTADLTNALGKRIADNKKALDDLFKPNKKPVDMTATTSAEPFVFEPEEPEEPKTKKGPKEPKELKVDAPKEEKAFQSAIEDAMSLNKRIQSAAAGGTPEEKIEKAVIDAGIKQAEKLDKIQAILEGDSKKMDDQNKMIGELDPIARLA